MTPLDLLREKLIEYQENLKKSEDALKKGLITKELHELHKQNNELIIQEYKNAIQTLIIFC